MGKYHKWRKQCRLGKSVPIQRLLLHGYAGGISGWNNGGEIRECTLTTNIEIVCAAQNYTGQDYAFAPEMGIVSGRSTSNPVNCAMNSNIKVYGLYLHTEMWTTGALW